MCQHTNKLLQRLSLGRIELRLNVLQGNQSFAVTADNDFGRRKCQVILDTLDNESDELSDARNCCCNRLRELDTEFSKIFQLCYMFGTEQSSCRIVLQRYRTINMQRQ